MQVVTVYSCSPIPFPSYSQQSHHHRRRLRHLLRFSPDTRIIPTPPPHPTIQIRRPNTTTTTTTSFTVVNSCSKEQRQKKKKVNNYNKHNPQTPPPHNRTHGRNLDPNPPNLEQSYSFQPAPTDIKGEKETKAAGASMWWADLKAALGQRVNLEGVVRSAAVVARDRHLAVPHAVVPDIRFIDWAELRRKGFRGVVFDKDNTITAPYSLTLWGPIRASIDQCKAVFGNDVAIFSNSAGLHQYDPDGGKAGALERATGIKVTRHRVKKPSGTSEEIEKHFGCASSLLVMVGDRHFTDIVYGNRNGFLTILTEPLTLAEEPFVVRQLRRLEVWLVKGWSEKGVKATRHSLLPDPMQCLKDPRPL